MKPKKLNIYEMWDVYQSLKQGLAGDEKEYLIDEVSDMLGKISNQKFLHSLNLLYPSKELRDKNAVEIVLIFIKGLKRNNFFFFVDFIKGITHGSSARE